jgi:hypothetical protein
VGADGAIIQLVTRCNSAEEFIERFAKFTTQTDLMVPVLPHVTLGTAGQFVIRLHDGAVVMQGRCEVTEIRPGPGAAAGPLGRGLMRLRLREMDAPSWGIHLRLMERHAPPPVPVPAAPDTEPMRFAPEPPAETRVPGASFTLPANPLSDLDAADLANFVELTLLEAKDGTAPKEPRAARTDLAEVRRIAQRALPYLSCVCAGLLLGIVLRPSSRPAGAAIVAPVAAAPAVDPPGALPEIPAPPPQPSCRADVTTTPPGAAVFWGGTALGTTPVEHATVPCGAAVVTFRHERYAPLARTMAADPGQAVTMDERLYRPSAKLVVTSSPPNAVILLNRRRLGHAPRKITTQQFEHIRIEASLPGYRPWKKTLYLKEAESTVDVALVQLAPAKTRRTK